MSWGNREASLEDILEVLGLDENSIYHRAQAADACFHYYRSSGRSSLNAGSMAVFSASCWSIIDSVTGRQRWRQAAEIYTELDHPYAQILPVCAGRAEDHHVAVIPRDSFEFSCQLLQLAWLSVMVPDSVESYRQRLAALNPLAERFGAHSSGQLLLPSKYIHEFTSAIIHDWPENGTTERFTVAAKRLLAVAATVVQSAQTDQYHWRRILPGFMPVEPEWLSIGRIIYESVVRSGGNSEVFSMDLTELENVPMQIAARMPPPEIEGPFGPEPTSPDQDSGDLPSLQGDEIDRP